MRLAKPAPFVLEHHQNARLKRIGGCASRHKLFDLGAACTLGARQHRVEHGAAGVGVDFDQAKAGVVDMKVVAKKYPFCTIRIMARSRRCDGEHGFAIRGHRHH